MADKTWIGGSDGNAAGSAANWSPTGAPQHGDTLNVISGTLEIGGRLAGDTLHLDDPNVVDGGPVVLDLNNANVSIEGSRAAGDHLFINATGNSHLDAKGGVALGSGHNAGTINLADHAHLVVSGSMQFGYGGSLTGGRGALLTNNGRLDLGYNGGGGDGTVSVAVNGSGTLFFHANRNFAGFADINAPIAAGQTVELDPLFGYGMTMTLADPADFHGLLKLDPLRETGAVGGVSVVVKGVQADGFSVHGNNVMLTNGGRPVDLLRVANAGSMSITPTFGTDTTLVFHA